jgi:hypothetical protein
MFTLKAHSATENWLFPADGGILALFANTPTN